MDITIQMLGTGSAFSAKYDNNNALVRCGGYTLLIDCGITAPRALHKLSVPFDQIDGIFISHLHGDHVGGLEEYAFQMLYRYKKRPVLWLPSTLRTSLWEHTLKGGMENASQGLTSLDSYFEVKELEEGSAYELHPGFTIELQPTAHIPNKPSYGLVMNRSVYYSADSTFDPELLARLHQEVGIRHILHDCQLQGPGVVHASLDELLTLPDGLQSLIWLMHYGDDKISYEGHTGAMRFIERYTPYVFKV